MNYIYTMDENQFKFKLNAVVIPLIMVFAIWFVYWIEYYFHTNFNNYGILPKSLKGLRGIFFSPFIHSSAKHLFNNSVPLAVMLWALYYFYNKIANVILIGGLLLTGILTWSFGRPSFHIGASGVVYFLLSFIFFSGIFRKYYRLVALSLTIVFLYGSMVWYIFPMEDKISWEGHLSGFLVGFVYAYLYKNKGPKPEQFQFSENKEFDEMFDENGNFSPPEEIDNHNNE